MTATVDIPAFVAQVPRVAPTPVCGRRLKCDQVIEYPSGRRVSGGTTLLLLLLGGLSGAAVMAFVGSAALGLLRV